MSTETTRPADMSARTLAKLENLEELLATDHNVPAVVARAGFTSVAAADKAARRAGRNDLAAVLRFYGPARANSGRTPVNVYGDGATEFYLRFGVGTR